MTDDAVIEMGKTARQWVENEYTVEKYSERLHNLYSRLGVSLQGTKENRIPNRGRSFLPST